MAYGKSQLEMGLEAIGGLLGEFRAGNAGDRGVEKERLEGHLRGISARWDERFPGLPEGQFAYSSFKGVSRRGVRDEYLKGIIVRLLEGEGQGRQCGTIVNPVSVWGRHGRDLARRMEQYRVIGTDINPAFERFYEWLPWSKTPGNYEFRQDDIFDPKVEAIPRAVVFFGACGSLSDAAMDYAIRAKSPCLICRTCCHDNIGGNTQIAKRLNFLNLSYRLKNAIFAKKRAKDAGEYFSPEYSIDHYPRSRAARGLSSSDEFLEISRNTVDSDICRTIIDLDRYLRLAEAGYDVWYRGEMFVAEIARKTQGHE